MTIKIWYLKHSLHKTDILFFSLSPCNKAEILNIQQENKSNKKNINTSCYLIPRRKTQSSSDECDKYTEVTKRRKKKTETNHLHNRAFFSISKLNIKEYIDILQLSQFLFEYLSVPKIKKHLLNEGKQSWTWDGKKLKQHFNFFFYYCPSPTSIFVTIKIV